MLRLLLVLAVSLLASACREGHTCFTAAEGANSRATREVFATRGLQGGGHTWLPLLERSLGRHAEILDADVPSTHLEFGRELLVRHGGARTWVVLDAEGGGAIVCSRDTELVHALEQDLRALNGNPTRLVAELDALGGGVE